MRCVGIIAGAKWLAIALWCRLELREIPFRTTLKIQTPRETDPTHRAWPTVLRASSLNLSLPAPTARP